MSHVVWSQWEDLVVPEGFTRLTPSTTPLATSDLSAITFFVPEYMSSKSLLEYSKQMPSLQYLQVPNAGFDDAIAYLRKGVVLCNARGVHNASTAELGVGLAITARRGFAEFAKAQQQGDWLHTQYASLNDSNIAIIGAGSISQTLQNYLAPYDVTITVYSRSGANNSKLMTELDKDLPSFDIVFLIMPLNEDSRNMFDARRLTLMKDGSLIVNIARGAVINTDALVAELNSGRLYAALDVTDPEPLPKGHPLWSAKNCIISPHVGGDSTAFISRGKHLIEEQLIRLSQGKEPINIVAHG